MIEPISITITRGRSGKSFVWMIYCPVCNFTFERTKIDIARSWIKEHMMRDHANTSFVVDES